jgi:hypothetical protein
MSVGGVPGGMSAGCGCGACPMDSVATTSERAANAPSI